MFDKFLNALHQPQEYMRNNGEYYPFVFVLTAKLRKGRNKGDGFGQSAKSTFFSSVAQHVNGKLRTHATVPVEICERSR